jgi:hypothetical protein
VLVDQRELVGDQVDVLREHLAVDDGAGDRAGLLVGEQVGDVLDRAAQQVDHPRLGTGSLDVLRFESLPEGHDAGRGAHRRPMMSAPGPLVADREAGALR